MEMFLGVVLPIILIVVANKLQADYKTRREERAWEGQPLGARGGPGFLPDSPGEDAGRRGGERMRKIHRGPDADGPVYAHIRPGDLRRGGHHRGKGGSGQAPPQDGHGVPAL